MLKAKSNPAAVNNINDSKSNWLLV